MIDIICLTCGQSPDEDAPRKIGDWDDAGHTDCAHRPVWSTVSFKGSEWLAHPNDARWYGEAIFEGADGETDYNYGYADSEGYPDIEPLVPEGANLLEYVIRRGVRHPEHNASDEDIVEMRGSS